VTSISQDPTRRRIRFADTTDYAVPRTQTKYGERAFCVAGPSTWNSLPESLRRTECTQTFKRHLKMHFLMFLLCFNFFTVLLTTVTLVVMVMRWDCWWWQTGSTAADMVDTLTSLFELMNSRSVYLHCLSDGSSQSAAVNRMSVPSTAAAAPAGQSHSSQCSHFNMRCFVCPSVCPSVYHMPVLCRNG